MKKNFRAQSPLEFMMIIILVILGVVVMGPYVIRSVNAYMRSWEISVAQANHNPNVMLAPWEVSGGSPSPPPTECTSHNDSDSCENAKCIWVATWTPPGTAIKVNCVEHGECVNPGGSPADCIVLSTYYCCRGSGGCESQCSTYPPG